MNIKMIPAIAVVAICWGIWAVKTLWDCKKQNLPVKLKLKELWNSKFWIGPEKFADIREILVMISAAVRLGYEIISRYNDVPSESNNVYFCFYVLVIYTFIFGRFTLKQYVVFGLFEVLIFLNPLDYNIALFCILAAYDIGTEKIKKLFFTVLSVLYSISFILSVSGVISTGDMSTEETRLTSDGWLSVRHSFGFFHPNTAGLFLSAWVVLFFAIRYSKMKWHDWLIGIAALGVITFVIDSRASAVFLSVFLILMFIAKYRSKFYDFKLIKFTFSAVPALCALATVFFMYFYNPDNALWKKINSLSTGRISLMSSAAKQIPLTLFGHVTHPLIFSDYSVDVFYAKFLLYQGLIPLLILIFCYVFLLYRLFKLKAYPEVALVVSQMVYCCFENTFFRTFTNYSFVLFPFIFAAGSRLFVSSENDINKEKHFSLKRPQKNC